MKEIEYSAGVGMYIQRLKQLKSRCLSEIFNQLKEYKEMSSIEEELLETTNIVVNSSATELYRTFRR
jgi:hypothetical protein